MSIPTFGGGRRSQPDPDVDDVEVPVDEPAGDQPHVVTNNPADARQAKVLFSGPFKDALRFIKDNFPRVHVEPGGNNALPDALLHAPNGDVFEHHGDGAVGADDNGLVKQEGN